MQHLFGNFRGRLEDWWLHMSGEPASPTVKTTELLDVMREAVPEEFRTFCHATMRSFSGRTATWNAGLSPDNKAILQQKDWERLGDQKRVACARCHGEGHIPSRLLETGHWSYVMCPCQGAKVEAQRRAYSGLASPSAESFGGRTQTFANFRVTPETREAFALAKAFAIGPTRHSVLTLQGSVGTGKTHLLQAIGWESLEAGRQPKFISVARYLEKLRSTYSDNSEVSFEELYRPLEAVQILLLDDLGMERLTAWAQEQLYKIVNHRYQERLAMAVSIRLGGKAIEERYGIDTADRLLDTGSGRVKVVSTGSKSWRTGR